MDVCLFSHCASRRGQEQSEQTYSGKCLRSITCNSQDANFPI
jgi:hypothetical protein